MKTFLTVLCGGFIALSLFVTTGNTVKAAEPTPVATVSDDCGCHDLKPLQGAERNKIVANLISNDEFKDMKKALQKNGYNWGGANSIEVIKTEGMILVGVPFSNNQGNVVMHVFINGVYAGPSSM
jgi:hypothetical protein